MPNPFARFNPFQSSRMASIFSKPADPGGDPTSPDRYSNPMGGIDFNPATAGGDNPYQQGGFQKPSEKRFFTGSIPKQQNPIARPASDDPQEQLGSFYNILQQSHKPGPAVTAYQQALESPPDPEKYKPSILRRIGTSITGAAAGLNQGAGAGIAAGQNFLSQPYQGALSTYHQRLQGLEHAASIESDESGKNREDIIAAANYQLNRSDKQHGWEDKAAGRHIEQLKADDEYIKTRGQLERWAAQSENEGQRNVINDLIARTDKAYKEGQNKIGMINAGTGQANAATNARNADVNTFRAETDRGRLEGPETSNAAANTLRAEKFGQPKQPDIAKALETAAEMMQKEGNTNIVTNQDAYGPKFKVKEGVGKTTTAEIQRRAAKLLNMDPAELFGPIGAGTPGGGRYEIGDPFNSADPSYRQGGIQR